MEKWCSTRWPESKFITTEHIIKLPFNGEYPLSYFRLIWRTAYVIVTTVIAMIFPFFNAFLALLGATSFWPLTVYFPVEMYIARTKLPRFSFTWIWLKILSWACLVISLMAAAGSIQSLAHEVKKYKPFQVEIWLVAKSSNLINVTKQHCLKVNLNLHLLLNFQQPYWTASTLRRYVLVGKKEKE